MRDRKSTGRISEDRKIFRRSRTEPETVPVQNADEAEKPVQEAEGEVSREQQIAAALRVLDLPEYSVSEVTAVETFEVGDQTVVQLKTGDFVRIAMTTDSSGGSRQDS